MNAYTINQQLDSLYKDLEAAHNNDEEAVCLMFNADSKKEAIQLITELTAAAQLEIGAIIQIGAAVLSII